jgi:phospholipid-binding lipoprotein MlaA
METSAPPSRCSGAKSCSRPAVRHLLIVAASLTVACSSAGCASLPPGERDPRDHVERFNRTMYKFNTNLDHAVLRPVARGYVKVTPAPIRRGLSNFLTNLSYTRTIVNDVFQGRLKDLGNDLARLVVNTTVGIGGFLDPATRISLAKHDRDFGQTLGKWGIHPGSYLVLPLLGPSDVRDAFGTLPDRFSTIDGYLSGVGLNAGLFSQRTLDAQANTLSTDGTVSRAYDPYAFVRSAWFQQRAYKVHEGDPNYLPDLPPLDAQAQR